MVQWLKNWIRKRQLLASIDPQRAKRVQNRLSLIYFLLAWNALGYTMYIMLNKNKTKGEIDQQLGGLSEAAKMAKLLKLENATVYRFDGLTYKGSEKLETNSEANSLASEEMS